MGWGTEKYLNIIYDDIKFRKYMLKEIRLTNVQKTSLRNRIRQLRIDYGQGLMHNVLHNRGITAGNLWKQIRLDPQTFFALPLICGKAVYKRFHRSV
jgi:hypothetical protein